MLLAFSGASTQKTTLEQDIEAAAAAGFRGLEIGAGKLDAYYHDWWHTDATAQLAELLQRHGLKPVSIASLDGFNFQGDQFELARRRARTLAERMRGLGCTTLVVVPGMAPDSAGGGDIKRETARTLRLLADETSPYGVALAFKPLGFHWSSVRALADAWGIVQEVARPEVGLALDMVQLYLAETKPAQLDQLDAAKVLLAHINDADSVNRELAGDIHRILPGSGVVPLADYLSHLKHIGYDGPCVLDVFAPSLWERDAKDVAQQGRAAMQKALKPYFTLE